MFRPRPIGIHFVLVNGEAIVALRIREDFNPLIGSSAPQIWVGESAGQRKWGKVLADMQGQKPRWCLPLFLKRNGDAQYTYMGEYVVTGSTVADSDLCYARKHIKHEYGLSRLVSLKRD